MKTGYSYIRFSTKSQMTGDSLRRQTFETERYCAEHGIVLNESLSFKDLGVSAFKSANIDNQLGMFLNACEDGLIEKDSYLIVESLDRLSRDKVLTALEQFLGILKYCNIVTLTDKKIYKRDDANVAMDLIISITIMSRAYEESATKSYRLANSWEQRRKNMVNKPATSIAPHWLKLSENKNTWIIDQAKSDVIKLMFQKALDGYGQNKLVTYLNNNNIPSAKGNGWSTSSVKKILTDKRVLGELQPYKFTNGKRLPEGEPVSNYYPPIIDNVSFYAVQKIRSEKTNKNSTGRKGKVFSNLFQGLLFCKDCNSPMHYVNKGNTSKGGQYLVCSNAKRGRGCDYISYRYFHLENFLLMIFFIPNFAESIGLTTKKQIDPNLRQSLEGEILDINKQIENLMEVVSGDMHISVVKTKFENLNRSLKENTDKLEKANQEIAYQSVSNGRQGDGLYQLLTDLKEASQKSEDDLYALRLKLNIRIKEFFKTSLTIGKSFNQNSHELSNQDLSVQILGRQDELITISNEDVTILIEMDYSACNIYVKNIDPTILIDPEDFLEITKIGEEPLKHYWIQSFSHEIELSRYGISTNLIQNASLK